MNVGSLFSGIGGIEIGFEKEGFTTKWFVENNLYCQAILKKRFPEAQIYGDITTLDFTSVPPIDILTGGFPCQDISNAGKRIGITGSRSSLWKYYVKAISTLQPKFALIENVAALLNRGLSTILCDLAKVGYDAEWHIISASSIGAPHRRERVFIVAYSNSIGLLHGELEEFSTEGGKSPLVGVKCCSSKISDSSRERLEGNVWSRLQESKGKRIFEWSGENVENSLSNETQQRYRQEDITREEGTEHSDKSFSASQRNGWWATEPLLGRVAHGISNRVDRIKCLGNAVVPACAQVFAKAIKEVLE